MSFTERQQAAGLPSRRCPYCGAPAAERFCGACGRDTAAPRRPCGKCGRMVMSSERACWNCGAGFPSDLWWKIPLIIFLFLLAFAVSVVLALLK